MTLTMNHCGVCLVQSYSKPSMTVVAFMIVSSCSRLNYVDGVSSLMNLSGYWTLVLLSMSSGLRCENPYSLASSSMDYPSESATFAFLKVGEQSVIT